MRFFVTFLFLNFDDDADITGSKSGFKDDFGNITQKPLFYAHFGHFFCQTPLRNSIAMTTPKIPGDQKLFGRVC